MKGKMRYIYNAGLLLLLLCSSCTERTLETRPDPVPIFADIILLCLWRPMVRWRIL